MSSIFKRLHKIDIKTKHGVYGWIRRAEDELQIQNIPSMISNICLLYFHEEELFDIIGANVAISKNKKCITKHGRSAYEMMDWDNNTYGMMQIESNLNNIYQWDLKIHHIDYKGLQCTRKSMLISITNSITPNKYFNDLSIRHSHISYVIAEDSSTYDHSKRDWKMDTNGFVLNNGDNLSVILDLSKAEINIILNGLDKAVMFQNIVKNNDIKYRLMVSMGYPHNSVEISGFSVRYK